MMIETEVRQLKRDLEMLDIRYQALLKVLEDRGVLDEAGLKAVRAEVKKQLAKDAQPPV